MALATKAYNGYRRRNFIQIPLRKVRKLVFKRYSCIQEVDHNMKIALSPKYLGDIGAGIKEILDKELFCYNETLKGVPLAYDKITVLSSAIIDDQEFISVSIKVNLLVFKPEIGQNIYGVVNKISKFTTLIVIYLILYMFYIKQGGCDGIIWGSEVILIFVYFSQTEWFNW